MNRLRHQRGSSLILIMGVIATLAILAAAIVMLTVNMQGATATDRTQSKAFNIAEAGLDAGQSALWVNWPTTTAPTVDAATFRAQFSTSEFPNPKSGSFIDVQFYDDDGNLSNPGTRTQYDYDENQNGRMWIESTAATGKRAAKVMALVNKVDYQLQIMPGVALATAGTLTVKGTGNQAVVGYDPPATAASVYDGTFDPNGQAYMQDGTTRNDNTTADYINQNIFPTEVLGNLIQAAGAKHYATQAQIPDSAWSTDPRIIVIDGGGVNAKDIPNTDGSTVWTEDHPGILIVLNGDMDDTGQKKTIYGIVYLATGLLLRGNAEIHGMVVAMGSADCRGTRAVCYNGNVINNLNKPTTLSVTVVPNTWRELSTEQP